LEKHYARAEISARLKDDVIEVDEPANVTRFTVFAWRPKLRIGKTELAIPKGKLPGTVIVRTEKGWVVGAEAEGGKRPGLQGAIDDAFTSRFLCVRGTGKPWNKGADDYAKASLKRFADEWEHYFRGKLPVKDDTAVTSEDIQNKNLIFFGDPGSNSWIAK